MNNANINLYFSIQSSAKKDFWLCFLLCYLLLRSPLSEMNLSYHWKEKVKFRDMKCRIIHLLGPWVSSETIVLLIPIKALTKSYFKVVHSLTLTRLWGNFEFLGGLSMSWGQGLLKLELKDLQRCRFTHGLEIHDISKSYLKRSSKQTKGSVKTWIMYHPPMYFSYFWACLFFCFFFHLPAQPKLRFKFSDFWNMLGEVILL